MKAMANSPLTLTLSPSAEEREQRSQGVAFFAGRPTHSKFSISEGLAVLPLLPFGRGEGREGNGFVFAP